MNFKHFEEFSPALNKGIQLYIERLDLDGRNRELFYDLLSFAYSEGKIAGIEELVKNTEDKLKDFNENEYNEENDKPF
jgi:hypothetical protein